MDEQSAWACFEQSGKIQDYLIYSQCRQTGAANQYKREDGDAVQNGWPGDTGEQRGGE